MAEIGTEVKRSEKDNDVVYLQPVPAPSSLAPIDKAQLAQITPFSSLSVLTATYKPLLTKLMPAAVYIQVGVYNERRSNIVKALNEKSQKIVLDINK
jgi:programmed cell death 6-interacting protein